MAFLQNFHDLQDFVFGYRAQNENPEITENLYFWIYKVQIHVDLLFDHYFNILSLKTGINKQTNKKKTATTKKQKKTKKKRRLNLTNLEVSESLEKEI